MLEKIKQLEEVPKETLVMKMFGKKVKELTKEEMGEYKRQYYLQNRQQVITRVAKWKKDNKDRYNKQCKERRERNLEKRREYEREYKRKQRCSVRLYKLAYKKACAILRDINYKCYNTECDFEEMLLMEADKELNTK